MKAISPTMYTQAVTAYMAFFNNSVFIPDIQKIEVNNHYCLNIYANNGKWYLFNTFTNEITEHNREWRL